MRGTPKHPLTVLRAGAAGAASPSSAPVRDRPRAVRPPRARDESRTDVVEAEQLERPLAIALSTSAATGYGRFVAAMLAACLAPLAAALALNVLVDPFALSGTGLLPPAVESDRSIKLQLIQGLSEAPEIVILGSSRARQAEPSYVERLTGHATFNAAVTAGTASDAWVMTRYTADRFPRASRYVWFVDAGIATNGINPQLDADPRAHRYLAGKSTHLTIGDLGAFAGVQMTRASLRVLNACVFGACKGRVRYLADGAIAPSTLRFLPEQAASLSASVDALAASVRAQPPSETGVDTARYAFFERTLAFMNANGARPVIVLNPIHPRVLDELRSRGFPARARSLAYLRALHDRFDFVVVDCQDIRRWRGSPGDFTNATHVNRRNMRRMLAYIVSHSDGALA